MNNSLSLMLLLVEVREMVLRELVSEEEQETYIEGRFKIKSKEKFWIV